MVKSEKSLQWRVRVLLCFGTDGLKNVNKIICVVAPLTNGLFVLIRSCLGLSSDSFVVKKFFFWILIMYPPLLPWKELPSLMTVLVLLCSGCWVLWVNVWLGLVGKKNSGFLYDSTGLIHSLLPCLKAIAFVDAGGFLVLGYEISVCWRVEKKIIFRHKTGVKLHCHSLLPCLEGILPALKYTFRMRLRKRVCVVGPCSHKDLGLVESY